MSFSIGNIQQDAYYSALSAVNGGVQDLSPEGTLTLEQILPQDSLEQYNPEKNPGPNQSNPDPISDAGSFTTPVDYLNGLTGEISFFEGKEPSAPEPPPPKPKPEPEKSPVEQASMAEAADALRDPNFDLGGTLTTFTTGFPNEALPDLSAGESEKLQSFQSTLQDYVSMLQQVQYFRM